MSEQHHRHHDTPLGAVLLIGHPAGLCGVYFDDHVGLAGIERGRAAGDRELDDARDALDRYFAGTLRAFALSVAPRGTAFQHRVWAALRAVPYGDTTDYRSIAARIGQPGAARAVGAASARNPLCVIVPCHRVVATGGALTGYAGGLLRKQALLDHERARTKAVVPWPPLHG